MKTLKNTIAILIMVFAMSCNKNVDATPAPTNDEPKAFNKDDYSEYFVCKVGDFQYNTGNSAGNTTSVVNFKLGSTLYLNASDGNFIQGNLASMEINMQLKNFTPNVLKSYDITEFTPTEILKYKHVGGDNYDTINGTSNTPQPNVIVITKIENNFYFGTFAFKTYKTSNRSTVLQLIEGSFKFKYNP